LKLISFSAKRARGAMARFIIKNQIQDADDLKSFDLDGYRYDSSNSDEKNWFFVR